MFGREVVEKASAAAEQHRDHVEFQLVELAGAQQCLRPGGPCTMATPSSIAARACAAHSATSVT